MPLAQPTVGSSPSRQRRRRRKWLVFKGLQVLRMGLATQMGRRKTAKRGVTKRHLLTAPCTAAVLAVGVAPTSAQSVPTGYQEYFVLGYEQHTWDMMDKVQNGEGGAQFADGMNSVVTAAASADNQVIFYDHWEDGFEADLLNPVQASTLVIGRWKPGQRRRLRPLPSSAPPCPSTRAAPSPAPARTPRSTSTAATSS